MENEEARRRNLFKELHLLDKRVAIVEARQAEQSRELRAMHESLNDLGQEIRENTNLLRVHTENEARDRIAVSMRLNFLLASVLTSIVGGLGYWLVTKAS
jgi:uncharacterized protein YlxW (UPF0749 family)